MKTIVKAGSAPKSRAKEAEIRAKNEALMAIHQLNHSARDLSFAEAGKWFFENRAVKNKRSWKNDRARIAVMSEYFGSMPLKRMRPEDIEEFLDSMQKKRQISDHTRNHWLGLLKSIYNRLRKRRMYRGENPADYVEIKKVPRARVRFLYPSEEKELTPVVLTDPIVWPYYVVALMTGMRAGEIAQMQVKDVSIAVRHIFVPNSKSSRSRHIPLSEDLAGLLEELIRNKAPEDYALAGVIRDYISRRFKWLCEKAGISNFRFHDLRHTFAARLLTKGVPIYKVSKILGHSSVVVTEQHYGHLSQADLKDAVDQINGTISNFRGLVATKLQRDLLEDGKRITRIAELPHIGGVA